jgi:hypothetical protein
VKRLPAGERLDVSLDAQVAVVRVQTVGPPAAHFLLGCAAAELQPCPVHEIAHRVRSRRPDGKRCAIRHVAELLFFRPPQSFDLRFQFGDPLGECCYFLDLCPGAIESNLNQNNRIAD